MRLQKHVLNARLAMHNRKKAKTSVFSAYVVISNTMKVVNNALLVLLACKVTLL